MYALYISLFVPQVRTREHYSKDHDEICFQLETFGMSFKLKTQIISCVIFYVCVPNSVCSLFFHFISCMMSIFCYSI